MADFKQEVHKPGPLKQKNKLHKHGRHKSKGSIENLTKGRVDVKSFTGQKLKQLRRIDRKNQLKQLRDKKRHEVQMSKRSLGTDNTPPHLVVVLSTSLMIGCQEVLSFLSGACKVDSPPTLITQTTLIFPVTKQRFTFVCPPPEDLDAILNVVKIADTLLLVYDTTGDTSPLSDLALDCAFAQGLPSTFHIVQGLDTVAIKKQGDTKKRIQSIIDKRFPKEKLHRLDSQQDACNVLRFIGSQKQRPVFVRDARPHLLADSWSFSESTECCNDDATGVLSVSGYLHGKDLSVNQLVHITGFGDYQMIKIEAPPDPCPLSKKLKISSHDDNAMITDDDDCVSMVDSEIKLLAVADPTKQVSLMSEVVPDPMEGEQTWPLEEELREAQLRAQSKKKEKRMLPKGTSEYQASWILDEGEGEEEEEEEEEEEGESDEEYYQDSEDDDCDTGSFGHTDMDTDDNVDPDHYDALYNMEDERKQLDVIQAERMDQLFPDEVDTPLDISARVRFAKYRGLRSFRNSPWDPKENLPLDYARIFQFSNFRSTRKKVLSSKTNDEEGISSGTYLTLHIAGVPRRVAEYFQLKSTPLVVHGLLPHENKMSVVNFVLRRTANYTKPIRSKDELIFHCGLRRFAASPIYSQHTLADKHKGERFFRKDCISVATVYAPISYPPTKVLAFKQLEDGSRVLVATGSVYSVNPDRIVCKKIILSGHPFKIFKRSAVIRYMFYNRDDIMWFKPVELKTKLGLRGHIKEPLGTHGHMKCVFDKPLKAHDTVLMCLYKRMFPHWSYSLDIGPPPSGWGLDEREEEEENFF